MAQIVGEILLIQSAFASKALKEHKMLDYNLAQTPPQVKLKFGHKEKEE